MVIKSKDKYKHASKPESKPKTPAAAAAAPSKRSSSARSGGGASTSSFAAAKQTPEESIRALQRQHTLELMDALQVEKEAEAKREKRLRQALSDKDRARLDHAYSSERRAASERIMRMTEEHEAIVSAKRKQLGLTEPVAAPPTTA